MRKNKNQRLILTLIVGIAFIPIPAAFAYMCPDGSYVSKGPCNICPDGSYIGGGASCQIAPDGTYVPKTSEGPKIAPDGTYVSGEGRVIICPDGTYVSGNRCKIMPDGSYVGSE